MIGDGWRPISARRPRQAASSSAQKAAARTVSGCGSGGIGRGEMHDSQIRHEFYGSNFVRGVRLSNPAPTALQPHSEIVNPMKSLHARRLLVPGLAVAFLATGMSSAAAAAPVSASAPSAPTTLAAPAAPTAEATAQKSSTYIVYRTFIKESRVNAFPCAGAAYQFNGNGRSYSTKDNAGFKTNMAFGVNWKTSKVHTSKKVSETKLYLGKKLISRKTATSKNMKFTGGKFSGKGSSRAYTVTLKHSATNPFCTKIGGAIDYQVKITVYRSGKVVLAGSRRKAPHHESYVFHNSLSGKRTFLLTKKSHGLKCLQAPLCKRESLKVTLKKS
ncbi:hypothetical protein [Actinomadura sp. 6N118]|uniref:hypothetical protein n=1 Tax=Actinomadura sp. 6N118 TaxID=3375151 RepID=UPI0037A103B3